MINVGHIVPVNYLDVVQGRPFHLILAHMVKENKAYRDFYKEEAKNGATIVLDNSSYELGDNWISPEGLIEIYNSLESNNVYLMCPEVAYNSSATILAVKNFTLLLEGQNLHPKTFGTIHGQTISDLVECYTEVSTLVDYIGFSYRIWCDDLKIKYPVPIIEWGLMRIAVIRKLFEKGVIDISKPHHLLGISDPCELYEQSEYYWIKSADSSTAYVQGSNNIRFSNGGFEGRERVESKLNFEDLNSEFARIELRSNMKVLDTFAKGEKYE